jgi:hypothetical protein
LQYHQQHGTKFSHGYSYRGRYHNHWHHRQWDSRYGTYLFWDRGLRTWYYWCQPDDCYYPISYVPYQRYSWETTPAPSPEPTPTPCQDCTPVPPPATNSQPPCCWTGPSESQR